MSRAGAIWQTNEGNRAVSNPHLIKNYPLLRKQFRNTFVINFNTKKQPHQQDCELTQYKKHPKELQKQSNLPSIVY